MGEIVSNLEGILDASLARKIERASHSLPRPQQWRLFKISLILSDVCMIGGAFWLAFFVRFKVDIALFQQDVVPSTSYYRTLVLVLLPVWLVIFSSLGLYNRQNLLGGTQEYARVFRGTTIGFLIVIVAGFLDPNMIIARGWMLMVWAFTFFFAVLGRFTIRRAVYALRQQGFFLTPAIIVGGNQEGRWLAQQLLRWKTSGMLLLGFVDEKVPPDTILFHNLRALGTVDQLDDIIKRYDVGELILATSAISSRNKQLEIFKKYGISSDVNVRMSSGLYEIITTGLTVSEFAYVPFVNVNKARLTGIDEAMKLAMDYLLTIPGLIAISPILLVTAIAVKLDSPGPVIHRRWVMGMRGKGFYAYKFRTMHVHGDRILADYPELQAELAQNHKLKNDPRITRIGKYLRKFSLDELPQLFNVLRREMSLVGPRMITPEEIAKYTVWDINLLTVRPGITGMWQVSGRSDVSYDERVQLDMYYVRNWSIWMDLQLLLQTIPAVLKGRGAY